MFERFAKAARNFVTAWVAEAERRHDPYVGSEHFLIGLLREPSDAVARSMGISVDDLRAGLDSMDEAALGTVGVSVEPEAGRSSPGPRLPQHGHRPFTGGAKQILEGALAGAVALGHRRLGPEHILLAITERPGRDLAIRLLERVGLSPKDIRSTLFEELRRSA